MSFDGDEIARFYERHPYPPPVENLDDDVAAWSDGRRRRVEHARLWPTIPYRDDHSVLIAGCGTSQAARYALRYPNARVVGIDVSPTSVAATRRLVERYGITNLELHLLPIEDVGALGIAFDHVVCTGVLHHLADPDLGLRTLRDVIAPEGAIHLMVYASYGRFGIHLMQDYCRRLGVKPDPDDIADLVSTLRELPMGHPLSHLLRNTPDFTNDDALADALLNPRDRSYTVPEALQLIDDAGLRFGRWVRQASYRPQCGALTEVPHGLRIAAMSEPEQFAAVELLRGTMVRHNVIAYRNDSPLPIVPVRWDDECWRSYVAIRPTTVTMVEERLPPGVAAVLINRAHTDRDLVVFLDPRSRRIVERLDDERPLGDLSAGSAELFQRLWLHDLIMVDASTATA